MKIQIIEKVWFKKKSGVEIFFILFLGSIELHYVVT